MILRELFPFYLILCIQSNVLNSKKLISKSSPVQKLTTWVEFTSEGEAYDSSTIYAVLVFISGLCLGYFGYFLYRYIKSLKLSRVLDESSPLFHNASQSNIDPFNLQRARKFESYSISNPLSLQEQFFNNSNIKHSSNLDLSAVFLESEARWQNFHKKKTLANTILQNSTEPPLGRQLRMAVRSCLHSAEVSPESIAIDQTFQPWDSLGVSCFASNSKFKGTQTLRSSRSVFGHRSSKSTTSIHSNFASIRGKTQDSYTNQGSFLISGDDLRNRITKSPEVSPFNPSKTVKIHSTNSKPLSFESQTEPMENCIESKISKSNVFNSDTPEVSDSIPSFPNLPPAVSSAQKTYEFRSKVAPFQKNTRVNILSNHKPLKNFPKASSPQKPLLDRQFFNNETIHEWTLPNYGKIRFTDHAPMAFRLIRRYFGYSLNELDRALSVPFGSVSTSAGKSDAIFFLTHNNAKFLFKTLRNSEPDNLKALLPDYLEHIRTNPNTLLPRYLGMYTFERLSSIPSREPSSPGVSRTPSGLGHKASTASIEAAMETAFPLSQQQILPSSDEAFPQKMILVAMANVFESSLSIHERYDFKGSNVGRHTLPNSVTNIPPTIEERRQKVAHLTLKDLDFQYRVFQGLTNLIHLGPQNKQELMAQLEEDLNLLKKFSLMDYSVLVGIHRTSKTSSSFPSMITPSSSLRGSRSGSVTSSRNLGNSPLASPLAHSSIIHPFISSASNLISSILLPSSNNTPTGREQPTSDYFGDSFLPKADSSPISSQLNQGETSIIWKNGVRSVKLPNTEFYFIGIIDVLQKFTITKWLEKGIKGYNTRLLGGTIQKNPVFDKTSASPGSISRSNSTPSSKITSKPSPHENSDIPIKPTPTTRQHYIASSLPQDIHGVISSQSNPDGSTINLSVPSGELASNPQLPLKNSRIITQKSNLFDKYDKDSSFTSRESNVSENTHASFLPQQIEHSVEDPRRYSERLLEYIRGIIV